MDNEPTDSLTRIIADNLMQGLLSRQVNRDEVEAAVRAALAALPGGGVAYVIPEAMEATGSMGRPGQWVGGWNACRNAMLASAKHSHANCHWPNCACDEPSKGCDQSAWAKVGATVDGVKMAHNTEELVARFQSIFPTPNPHEADRNE